MQRSKTYRKLVDTLFLKVQDFLIKLGIKPRMHLLETGMFSLYHVILLICMRLAYLLEHTVQLVSAKIVTKSHNVTKSNDFMW